MSAAVAWRSDVELADLNTFHVRARARRFCRVENVDALIEAAADCQARHVVPFVLGGGSNLLILGDLDVPVIQPALLGLSITPLDGDRVELQAAAGEPWDAVVSFACRDGLWGVENLALIPGSAGAAPVQNIGAYGVELGDRLAWVEALDLGDMSLRRLPREELALGYRDSRFKAERGRWIITRIALHLLRSAQPKLGYAGLREAFGDGEPTTPGQVADAVRAIRRRKLPDPAQVGNAGSFFKNPELPDASAAVLAAEHPGLPVYPGTRPGFSKLSAGWLIERAGCKGLRHGDAGVSDQHALVLVNHGAACGRELFELAEDVRERVRQRFGVRLEPEPVILGGMGAAVESPSP
ncbi:UDP-N-acetylmuramate dehydrogenase [Aquimonas voraii]|uniref:UDP-N-acetylenolpyruvoylglucosamine reductase n=1 Tax=Aquimonas voraii TaxID=265719 RepID=A0A1G6T5U7_9GAMM|nr:UDP-N-acetylmuramate dehydrogenase [Aquimonas voraii]SDD23847.1 UDP-N-acetylmuramate dehydrogenase [Aquimonas voraii]